MSRHHWFGHYPEQHRSSETIGLRTKDTLQLNKTKQTFYQVQFIWKQTRIWILQEYKYYTECMRAIIWINDARIIVKRLRMLSTQSVALYKTCKPKPRLSTHICVTRPQWVKTEKDNELPIPGRFFKSNWYFRYSIYKGNITFWGYLFEIPDLRRLFTFSEIERPPTF